MPLQVRLTEHVRGVGERGATPTLPDDQARQLVYEKRAVMLSTDVPPLRTPVLWSDSTAGSLVKPDGGLRSPLFADRPVMDFEDDSATPGNVTNHKARGRVGLALGASTIVVTSSLVTAASTVICQLRSTDGVATDIRTVTPAAGSFTITFNAAATGAGVTVDFIVVN
jgi:hypothetical protein